MATVFLARDVKHDRKVALKVLDPELGAVLGAERFLAEIKVTANLQHPNLLPLFDSGEAGGLLFYVMPFVEGESLRARLDREKQLPVDEAVRIATAVANALDYAHSHGVIHRDLKPENILLQAGQPVVADFGIALAVSNAGGARITQTGLSLGTPQYMSPEQATGDRSVDGRTDIYSLGAMTYEMLTGEPPHTGTTTQAIVAKLMTEDVRPLTVLRRNVPPHVDAAVRHALEKLPADRFGTAHEFADALNARWAAGTAGIASPAAPDTSSPAASGSRGGVRAAVDRAFGSRVATVAGFVLAAGVAAAWWLSARRAEAPAVHMAFFVTPSQPLGAVLGRSVAISWDGKTVVYATADSVGRDRLFARTLDDLQLRAIAGTDGAQYPFFSPDGRSVGFFDGRQLRKVSLEGGTPTLVADLPNGMQGASWGPRGIVISSEGKLALVPAGGGAPRTLAAGDSTPAYWPVVIANGEAVLYSNTLGPNAQLAVATIPDGSRTVFDLQGTPLGVVDGQLIYGRADGALMAAPFDERRLRVTGNPTVMVGEVGQNTATGEAKAAVSASGSLVYLRGFEALQLVRADARGAARPLSVPPGMLNYPRFSPDGKRVVLDLASGGRTDVWIYELASGASQRLTTEGTLNHRPEWSPDGKRILYRSNRTGHNTTLWWQPADGSGAAQLLVAARGRDVWQGSLAPDGRTLVYRTGTVGQADIWYRRLEGDTAQQGIATTSFTEYGPRISPDGRWVAYASNASGGFQVYVRPFPGPGAEIPISVGGGQVPVWSRDGRRIFYANGQKLIAATVATSPMFAVTARQVLFEGIHVTGAGHAEFDVSPDGQSFLMLRPVTGREEQIVVIHNWKTELRARATDAVPR
jgi:serine/threonine-protein kinase